MFGSGSAVGAGPGAAAGAGAEPALAALLSTRGALTGRMEAAVEAARAANAAGAVAVSAPAGDAAAALSSAPPGVVAVDDVVVSEKTESRGYIAVRPRVPADAVGLLRALWCACATRW